MGIYYCEKCRQPVIPRQGEFIHPHARVASCKVCPKCGYMVYLKDDKSEKQHA